MFKIAHQSEHGFNTAVLTQKKEVKPTSGVASFFSEEIKTGGYFLISKSKPKSKDDPKLCSQNKQPQSGLNQQYKTTNRKSVTTEDTLNYNGQNYRVNSRKSGLYVEILKAIIDQFEIAASLWRRVFVLRFDLHQEVYTEDSRRVSAFVKRISIKLKREYGFKKIKYFWVREQEKSKAQHYHFVLMLDGRKIQHSKRILEIIRHVWEDELSGFHVPHIPRPFHFGKRDEIADDVIYRISYFAKARGKGYRPKQSKDYGCSRVGRSP